MIIIVVVAVIDSWTQKAIMIDWEDRYVMGEWAGGDSRI